MSPRLFIGWMIVLGGALLQPPAFAENEAAAGYAAADVQAKDMAGLNFDTVFETYIGPIPVVEGDDGANSQNREPAWTTSDSPPLQLPPSPPDTVAQHSQKNCPRPFA